MKKDFILENVKSLNAEQLYRAVSSGVVSLPELKKTGKLNVKIRQKIEEMLERDAAKHQEEDNIWSSASGTNTIPAFNGYLAQYPNGRHADKARERIGILNARNAQQKLGIIEEIKNNPSKFPKERLQRLFEENSLTPQDLLNNGIITANALNMYMNPPRFTEEHIYGWNDLAPLAKDRTDIYFLGIPSSGKSCLLAGLLYYGNHKGKLSIEIHNTLGFMYAEDLIRCVDIGFVPPSTPNKEGANYISVTLKNKDLHAHPINFIEMSGEFFSSTYDSSGLSGDKNISANDYLYSDNRKIIFLIVDYHIGKEMKHNPEFKASQSAQLNFVLKLLEQNGTLKKTDAVFLVLTKSDLIDNGGANNMKAVEDFVHDRYAALVSNVADLSNRYGFEVRIYPFSLGNFMLGKTFTYDEQTSKEIFDDITRVSFQLKNKKNRFKFW